MRTTRTAVCAAVLGALPLPLVSMPTASAATTVSSCAAKPLTYTVHSKAVTIRSPGVRQVHGARRALPKPHVHRPQEQREVALHHGQDHRQKGLDVRIVHLP